MSEVLRRLVHASGSLVVVPYLLGLVPWLWVRAFLVVGTATAVVLEALRLRGVVDWWIYDRLTRDYEEDDVAGYFLYAVGMAVAGVLFPPGVAVPAVLMLTLADPVSGYLSSADLGEKEPWVMAVTFAICLSIALLLAVAPLAAVGGAAVATAADARTPVVAGYVVDDNFTIPVGAAATMWAVAAVV